MTRHYDLHDVITKNIECPRGIFEDERIFEDNVTFGNFLSNSEGFLN